MSNRVQSQSSQNDTNEPTEQALLVEYHMCQRHADTSSRRSWQSAGIFLAAALAGLALLVSAYISGEAFTSGEELENALAIKIAITVFVFIVIAVLELLKRIVRREVFFQKVCYRRMREIEAKLGLRRAVYVNILDNWFEKEDNPNWKMLSEDEKKNLQNNYMQMGGTAPKPRTTTATYIIIGIVELAWVLCLVVSWIVI